MKRHVVTPSWVAALAVLLLGLGLCAPAVPAAETDPVPEEAVPSETDVPDSGGTDSQGLFEKIKEEADATFDPNAQRAADTPKVTLVSQAPPVSQAQLEHQYVRHYNQTINMYREILLSIGLLVFGAATLGIECFLIRRDPKSWSGPAILRMIIITLIIISGSFLITSGYSNDQIVPIVGLLGSIAGYLLGKTDGQAPDQPQGGAGGGAGTP
ncbi:MAG: hypothetical protein IT365_08695 [Candidatus Hydrogenedentes bacterium]|nr:hypothetical protein [Candidatus Hydrogenedentota bacterium]